MAQAATGEQGHLVEMRGGDARIAFGDAEMRGSLGDANTINSDDADMQGSGEAIGDANAKKKTRRGGLAGKRRRERRRMRERFQARGDA